MENKSNLAPSFFNAVVDRYRGTRLGRQELDAEVLDDVPGALRTHAMLDAGRVKTSEVSTLERMVVAVDPAVTSDRSSEEPGENGIIVAGFGENQHAYVLDDASLIGTRNKWARHAVSRACLWPGPNPPASRARRRPASSATGTPAPAP